MFDKPAVVPKIKLPMSLLRVFTAVNIPHDLKRQVLSSIHRFSSAHGIRFVDSTSLHLNLNFIGNVKDIEIPSICTAFSAALDDLGPFEVDLHGLGAFPELSRPRALWVGVQQGKDQLITLNKKFRDIIEDFGFLQEKRYTPHLTIGRAQKSNPQPDTILALKEEFDRVVFGTFNVKEVIVYNSIPEKSGPNYVPLATLKL